MIKVKNINQTINKQKILSSINLSIDEGIFYALIGANGAGKSTLIKTITGAYPKDIENSEIRIDNKKDDSGKEIFSYIPEWEMYSKNQKVENFLYEVGFLRRISKNKLKNKISEGLKKFNLWNSRKVKIKNLSSGMRKKLLFIAAFLHEPKIIILDEPFANLDPPTKIEIINFLNEQKKQKLTALISSHMLSDIEGIVDHVLFLEKGKIINSKNLKNINYLTIISNNLSVICQFLQKQKLKYETDGISKVVLEDAKKAKLDEIVKKIYQLSNHSIVSLKINDLEQKYFAKYMFSKKEA